MTLRYPLRDYSAATGFGGNNLDRMSERRDDAAHIAALRADETGRTLLFYGDEIVLDGESALFTKAQAEAFGASWQDAVVLGAGADGPVFAAPLSDEPGAPLTTHHLRTLAMEGTLAHDVLGMVAQARGLLGWHARHMFCANCGHPTTPGQAGVRRDCANCGAHHFPRTDPVVIMLAVDGERCLLGRQTRFVEGVYSCLAGFMEPGETIEAAVRREIWEEAGIRTRRVAYHASQPWPFPSSLMIGCFAEATSFEIAPQDAELEDVAWFDRADIGPMLDRTHPRFGAPPPIAIAHHLLRAYAEHGAPVVEGATPPRHATAGAVAGAVG